VSKKFKYVHMHNIFGVKKEWLGDGLEEDVADGMVHGQVEDHGAGFHHGKDQDGCLVEDGVGGF